MNVQHLPNQNRQKLAYEYIAGAQPTVVFLGGYRSDMTGTKACWLAEFCQSNGHAYLRLDYSGHGQSEGQFEDGTIGVWADDAFKVIEHATDGPLVLVGSSMGGWIMLLLASRLRDRLAGLIGIAAAPDFTRDLMWPELSEQQQNKLKQEGMILLPSEYEEEDVPLKYAFIQEGSENCVLDAPLQIECPVRLLHGQLDEQVPWQTSLNIAEKVTGNDVTVKLFKQGDHRLSEENYLREIGFAIDSVV